MTALLDQILPGPRHAIQAQLFELFVQLTHDRPPARQCLCAGCRSAPCRQGCLAHLQDQSLAVIVRYTQPSNALAIDRHSVVPHCSTVRILRSSFWPLKYICGKPLGVFGVITIVFTPEVAYVCDTRPGVPESEVVAPPPQSTTASYPPPVVGSWKVSLALPGSVVSTVMTKSLAV